MNSTPENVAIISKKNDVMASSALMRRISSSPSMVHGEKP
jgi:hypothetical protein